MLTLKVKRLYEDAVIPARGSALAAGLDLCAQDGAVIPPHTTILVGTGIAAAIPEGYFGGLYARSGLASKFGLRPANCVGVIDADYRGEIKVAVHNDGNEEQVVEKGQKIAQLIVQPYPETKIVITDELPETQRGDGGFGSTGR